MTDSGSENAGEANMDPDEKGAEAAGNTDEVDAGYGGPDPEAEVAPGFDGGSADGKDDR